jgi:Kef-type K+ transport system membrane component KefB
MPLLTSLLILLVVARVFGQVFDRFRQPAIVGEMLAGVLLGPSVLNVIQANAALRGISELAVFLVVLSAGLEMKFKDVTDAFKGKGILVSILGFLIPFLSGVGVGETFDFSVTTSILLGLCVSITALPVTVRIMQSFNLLDSRIAKYSVASAVFTDVLALMILGVILNLPNQKTFQSVAVSVLANGSKLVLLSAFVIGFNVLLQVLDRKGFALERFPEKIAELLGHEALFGLLILFVLVFGSASEVLGFHFVIGAFFGALLIDKKFFLAQRYNDIERTVHSITGGFLAPVFFAYLGIDFNLGAIHSVSFVAAVLAVSILSKIAAGWLGGRMAGLTNNESLGIGVILNGRGIMELVIASIAYERQLISQGLFSTLILMGVVTTMITPILFRKWVLPGALMERRQLQGADGTSP